MFELSFWKTIIESDYTLPDGADLDALTAELLTALRSTDPFLRDDVGYTILTQWLASGKYSGEQMQQLMDGWLKDVREQIGATDGESVLVRSFASLMLSVIVYVDWKNPFLSEAQVHQLVDAALSYFRDEQDVRGYHPQWGWMHSVAHTADWLKFLARNPRTTAEHHQQILDAIRAKLTQTHSALHHNEDERLALAVLDVVKRETITLETWRTWVTELLDSTKPAAGAFDVGQFLAGQNIKQFCRSLYFRLTYNKAITAGNDIEYLLYEVMQGRF